MKAKERLRAFCCFSSGAAARSGKIRGQTSGRVEVFSLPLEDLKEVRVVLRVFGFGVSSSAEGLGREVVAATAVVVGSCFEVGLGSYFICLGS